MATPTSNSRPAEPSDHRGDLGASASVRRCTAHRPNDLTKSVPVTCIFVPRRRLPEAAIDEVAVVDPRQRYPGAPLGARDDLRVGPGREPDTRGYVFTAITAPPGQVVVEVFGGRLPIAAARPVVWLFIGLITIEGVAAA